MQTSPQKEIVTSFLNLVIAGKVQEAYDRYVSQDFRHHNSYFKGDRESLLRGMEDSEREMPNKTFQVQRAIEEGDLVVTHSRLQLKPGRPHMAVVHIFRLKGGKIIELWDMGQEIPKDSPNENGPF